MTNISVGCAVLIASGALLFSAVSKDSLNAIVNAYADPTGIVEPQELRCAIVPPGRPDPAPLVPTDGRPAEGMFMRGMLRRHAWPTIFALCPGIAQPVRVLEGRYLLEDRYGEPSVNWDAPGERTFWTACSTVYDPLPAFLSLYAEQPRCKPLALYIVVLWWAVRAAVVGMAVAWLNLARALATRARSRA
jgi:hypothetical protein